MVRLNLMRKNVKNIFTVDLEDWFHLPGVEDKISISEWDTMESRVEQNTTIILELLDKHKIKATFFVLGWIADRYPQLVKTIDSKGHEIGTHGYYHLPIFKIGKQKFDSELKKSISSLKKIINKDILGHRAPFFSIKDESIWAFEILRKNGIIFDSSIFPQVRDLGGIKNPTFTRNNMYKIKTKYGSILEYPMSMYGLINLRIPVCGGGYFRSLPYKFFAHSIRRLNNQGIPCVFYIHPRDIDSEQPVLDLSAYRTLKAYMGLKSARHKLEKLLCDFNFRPMGFNLEVKNV